MTSDNEQLQAWFGEARRLFDEAEERLTSGDPLPALSSLVAVPPLHRMIVDRCSALLDGVCAEEDVDDGVMPGLYV